MTSLLTGQARAMIGRQSGPITIKVEANAIRRFAEAAGDFNPLYQDPEYARHTRWGGIIAPPTFVRTLAKQVLPEVPIDAPLRVNGGDAITYGVPIRPGDVITGVSRYAEISKHPGRHGPMVFVITETTFVNQHGAFVASLRGTIIAY